MTGQAERFVVAQPPPAGGELRRRRDPLHRGAERRRSTSSRDLGDDIGSFTPRRRRSRSSGSRSAFAYMVVITGICLVVQTDVVRYRPLSCSCSPPARRPPRWRRSASTSSTRRLHLPAQLPRRRLPRRRLALLWSRRRPDRSARRAVLKAPTGARCRRAAGSCAPSREAMAPGVDGAAGGRRATGAGARDAGAVAPLAERAGLALSQRACGMALRALDWLPFPWRFSRASLDARQDFLAQARGLAPAARAATCCFPEGARRARIRKRPAGPGRGRIRDALRGRGMPPLAGAPPGLGDLRAAAGRRGVRRCHRRLGRRRRRRGRRSWPRRGSTSWCSRRAATWTAPATPRSRSRRSRALPGRRPDDRRGPAGDPHPGRASGRRHDRDQLGHLLPGARRGPGAVGVRARDRVGHRAGRRLCGGRGDARRPAGGPRAHGPKRPAPARGRRGARRRHEPLSRNAGRCYQCSSCPAGCRLDAKRAMHVSYLPRAVAAGARVRAETDVRRVALRARPRHRRLDCVAPAPRNGRARPFRVRRAAGRGARRRRVRHAGAAPALGLSLAERRARPQPADPPGLLGGRALRRGGPRLGGRDAELRVRRVGGPRAPARGDLHAARVRRPVASRHRGRAPGEGARATTGSPRPASTSPTGRRAGSGSPATARCGSPTGSPTTTARASCSGSPAPRSSSTRPGPARCIRRSPGSPRLGERARSPSSRPRLRPGALRLEAFHPMGTARMDADPGRGRGRDRRRARTAPRASTSPTAACCRARSASTR